MREGKDATIGVALSGGGHRASAWALGALLYLVDVGASARVGSIASVSGGSITNGLLALRSDYSNTSSAEFTRDVVAPLAKRLAIDGTVFAEAASRRRKTAIVALGGVLAVAFLFGVTLVLGGSGLVWSGASGSARVAELLAGPVLVVAFVIAMCLLGALRSRGVVARAAYDRILYDGRKLSDVASNTEHVFCTTDVQFAEHVYWSARFVYSYRLGVGVPRDFLLADAVAASAAFPGGFPPVVLRSDAFAFEKGADELPARLVLLDGGIYDNMAEQWFAGLQKRLSGKDPDVNARERAARLRAVVAMQETPNELIVVNATPAFAKADIKTARWPAVEIAALLRTVLALHDNATSLRRQSLVDQFSTAEMTGNMHRGTLVHIGTDPKKTVQSVLSSSTKPERRARAKTAGRLLDDALGPGGTAVDWSVLVNQNKGIRTVLDPLGIESVANLMQHAYVLAAVQCHVFLEYPLPPEGEWMAMFGRERFEALARGEPQRSGPRGEEAADGSLTSTDSARALSADASVTRLNRSG